MNKVPTNRGFADPAALKDDPVLRSLGLRPASAKDGSGLSTPVARALRDQMKPGDTGLSSPAHKQLVEIDPNEIGFSEFADRNSLSLDINDPDLADLYASIKAKGQDDPVDIMRSPAGSDTPYWLIAGHKRLTVIRVLNTEGERKWPIEAILHTNIQDVRAAVLRMHRENAQRSNLSPYENGIKYQKWLDAGLFEDQLSIATEVNLSNAMITRYLQVARLPQAIIKAFRDPRVISVRWADTLTAALKRHGPQILECGNRIANAENALSPEDVLNQLLAAGKAPKASQGVREESVKIKNKTVFRIAQRGGLVSVKLPKGTNQDLQQIIFDEVKAVTERVLNGSSK